MHVYFNQFKEEPLLLAQGNRELNKIDKNTDSALFAKNNLQSKLAQNNYTHKENNWGLDNYLFSALMNNLPDVIYFKDLESRFIKINNGYLKKVGASSEEEILGKTDFEIFDYEHANSARKDELHIIKTGEPIVNKVEKEVLTSGATTWVSTTKLPLRNEQGEIIGTFGMSRNITESKIIEEKLKSSEARLRHLIAATTAVLYTVKISDPGFIITWVGDNIEQFGYTPEDAVVTDFLKNVIHPDDYDYFKFNRDSLIEDNRYVLEFRIKHKDGHYLWVRDEAVLIRDSNQKPSEIFGSWLDISERMKMEETLLTSETQLSNALKMAHLCHWEYDVEKDLFTFNDQFYSILHTTAKDQGGYTMSSPEYAKRFVHPDDLHLLSEEIKKAIASKESGYSSSLEHRIIYADGEEGYVAVKIFVVKDSEGKTIKNYGINQDITERKKAEEKLKETYVELEKTNKDLKKANKIKDQFLANMSHEIRTPLNAVIGMTGLLLDTSLNDEQRDFAQTIMNSGDILLTLINDILDFSKIEAQKIELEKQPFDVRYCIEEALELVASKAAEKKLELTYSIDQGLPINVIGDITRLRQILVNLLSNSIKFTEKGEVVISVSGQLQDNYRYMLHFSVRDTGLGIPLDRQGKLFQSFTQVDASTTRKFGGTGLGLAISKQLSELMGGTMWLESSGIPDEGTTFHFTMLTEFIVEKVNEEDVSALYGKTVLIVDDNETNRNILIQQTKSLGMKPQGISSGPETLELFKDNISFDLAILDYQMPSMDGIVLAKELQKLPSGKSFPYILLSSYGYRDKSGSLSNFTAILTKPIKFSHLKDVLLTVLKENKEFVKKYKDISSMQFDTGIGKQYPLHILLAEDNIVNQKVARRFFEKLGYHTDVAFNGIEVLDAVQRQSYDVIFMDIQMPDMDGEQATMKIRKEFPLNKQPRIIAMTANALKSDLDRYLLEGMDDYIVKPFKIEELVRAMVESYKHLHPEEQKT